MAQAVTCQLLVMHDQAHDLLQTDKAERQVSFDSPAYKMQGSEASTANNGQPFIAMHDSSIITLTIHALTSLCLWTTTQLSHSVCSKSTSAKTTEQAGHAADMPKA